ncbi:MAG: hypothetical protein SOZ52_04845 [Pyramidobacter sp.]|nr:hypothetical protein [Pyramidobacter sp.]
MKLTRSGSDNISALSRSSLWVESLSGVVLNDVVTVDNGCGETFVGRVVAVEKNRCQVRICDGHHSLNRSSMKVWIGSDEIYLPVTPPLHAAHGIRRSIFKTGIAPVDTLFPIQHGQSVFIAGVTLQRSLPLLKSLFRGALNDNQWTSLISLDTSKNETEDMRSLWDGLGLNAEALFMSYSNERLYQSMTPLRLGFEKAISQAREGHDVFLAVADIDSWFRFYQEDLALKGYYRSRYSALNGFRNYISRFMELVRGYKGRITLAVLLSERKIAGIPSELMGLRDLFDSFLQLRRDGGISLSGYAPQPPRGIDRSVEYAQMLRRQCKDLYAYLREKSFNEYPLTEQERHFSRELYSYMGDLTSDFDHSADRLWNILSILPEKRLNRIPLTLVREFCHRIEDEADQ